MSARRRPTILLPLLLTVACAALAAVVYGEIQRLPNPPPIGPVGADTPASMPPLPPDPAFAMPPEDSFAAVVERPAFSPSRRPVHISGAGAATTFTAFALVGVIISDGERVVLVKLRNGQKLERLREGDELAGWSAVSIASDRVLFRRGTEEEEVILDYTAAAPAIHRQKPQTTTPTQQQQTAQPQPAGEQSPPQPEPEAAGQSPATTVAPAQPAPTEAPAE